MEWPALSAIAAACIVAGGMLRHMLDFAFVTGGKSTDLESIRTLLLAQAAKVELLYGKFSEHITDDARNFARLEAIVGEQSRQTSIMEQRISKAIEGLTDELRGINSRVDRLLENRDYRDGR